MDAPAEDEAPLEPPGPPVDPVTPEADALPPGELLPPPLVPAADEATAVDTEAAEEAAAADDEAATEVDEVDEAPLEAAAPTLEPVDDDAPDVPPAEVVDAEEETAAWDAGPQNPSTQASSRAQSPLALHGTRSDPGRGVHAEAPQTSKAPNTARREAFTRRWYHAGETATATPPPVKGPVLASR